MTTQTATVRKQYADFNTVVIEARIQHQELKSGKNGEYVVVTAITNLKDDEEGIAVRFTSSNGIMTLAKGGHLVPGRRVHITGTISGFASSYVDDKGQCVPLNRNRLQLSGVSLRLGAKPKAKA